MERLEFEFEVGGDAQVEGDAEDGAARSGMDGFDGIAAGAHIVGEVGAGDYSNGEGLGSGGCGECAEKGDAKEHTCTRKTAETGADLQGEKLTFVLWHCHRSYGILLW